MGRWIAGKKQQPYLKWDLVWLMCKSNSDCTKMCSCMGNSFLYCKYKPYTENTVSGKLQRLAFANLATGNS